FGLRLYARVPGNSRLKLHPGEAVRRARLVLVGKATRPAGLPARGRAAGAARRNTHLHERLTVAGRVVDTDVVHGRPAHRVHEGAHVGGRSLAPLPFELVLGVVGVVLDLYRRGAWRREAAPRG